MANYSSMRYLVGSRSDARIAGVARKSAFHLNHLLYIHFPAGTLWTACATEVSVVLPFNSAFRADDWLRRDEQICRACLRVTGRLSTPHDTEGTVVHHD